MKYWRWEWPGNEASKVQYNNYYYNSRGCDIMLINHCKNKSVVLTTCRVVTLVAGKLERVVGRRGS